MAKLYTISNYQAGLADLYFYCPGCKCDHGVWTIDTGLGHALWWFNEDFDKPTFTPSIKVTSQHCGITDICHMVITDGKIDYKTDSTHELAGKIVEMEEVTEK